jgi:hypothetical protein
MTVPDSTTVGAIEESMPSWVKRSFDHDRDDRSKSAVDEPALGSVKYQVFGKRRVFLLFVSLM